ncbi:uncharacterized protein LOC117648360 [Thrips palmi]|uniref:Uncharacterized protein LOC117648360 n=1 Tax=Thrips palmi TaxID=161013 RepID=A0A6P8Z8T4_THRPL|nr:uncharacterized protein LOC117648360 [Thrips palmi]
MPPKRAQTNRASGASKKSKREGSPSQRRGDASLPDRTADWCADCWGKAQEACRAGHQLVDRDAAWKAARDEFTAANKEFARAMWEFETAKEGLTRTRERLSALAGARASRGPVLRALFTKTVDCEKKYGMFYSVKDHKDVALAVHIALAATQTLSAEDRSAVCAALSGLVPKFSYKDAKCSSAHCVVKVEALKHVMEKLPDFLGGQTVKEGTMLLSRKGRLTIVFDEASMKGVMGTKLFGHLLVQGNFEALHRQGNAGRSCHESAYTLGSVEFVMCGCGSSSSTQDVADIRRLFPTAAHCQVTVQEGAVTWTADLPLLADCPSSGELRAALLQASRDGRLRRVVGEGSSIIMPGSGNSAPDSNTVDSELSPAGQQQKTASADWCADCWAAAKDACHGAHRLLDIAVAEEEATAEFTAAKQEVSRTRSELVAATQEAERKQSRLDALVDASVLESPVIKVRIDEVSLPGWYVAGGHMHIGLAATKPLTAADKRAICEALAGLEMEYHTQGTERTIAYGYAKVTDPLKGAMEKLCDYVEGQQLREGTVLLGADGQLEVFFPSSKQLPCVNVWVSCLGTKVLGLVQTGLSILEGEACIGVSHCGGDDGDCFCERRDANCTLSEVEFVM